MTFVDHAYTQGAIGVQCIYLAQGNGPKAAEVAGWFDTLSAATGFPGLLARVTSIVVIEATMVNATPLIRDGKEGYYDPASRVIWMASHAASPDLLAHEAGHHVSVTLGPAPSAELIAEVFKATFAPKVGSVAEVFRSFAHKSGW